MDIAILVVMTTQPTTTNLVFLLGNNTFLDELFAVLVENVFHLLDLLVHEWLCEHWLVDFVVAVLAIAHLTTTVCL